MFTCLDGPGFASTFVSLVSASNTERPECFESMLCVCNGARCLGRVCVGECKGSTGSSGLKVLRLIKLLV